MCGRYANSKSGGDMAALFDAEDLIDHAWTPSWNIAPTATAPVVRRSKSQGGRVAELARWGLVPPWASDLSIGAGQNYGSQASPRPMFNARIETVATSRAYRRPFASRRALIPADGWYEWRKLPGGGKQPYFFTRPGGVVFAGLWETWQSYGSQASPRGQKGDVSLISYTVLTCPAMNEALETVHDRMPYVLPPERFSAWLGEEDADEGELLAGPRPKLAEELEIRKVGRAVGRTSNDGPDLIRPIDAEEGPSTLPGL